MSVIQSSRPVINSSIENSSTPQAFVRIGRDLFPFKADAVIFSFDHTDVKVSTQRTDQGFLPILDYNQVAAASNELFATIAKQVKGHKAYMTPTPVIPAYNPPIGLKGSQLDEWESRQRSMFNKCLAHSRSCAKNNDIPIIDVAARFGINGEESARKWMKDWFNPNDHGQRNIINWAAAFIESTGLYE